MKLAMALLLAGCTVMGETRIDGWPALAVTEHYVSHSEMRDRCAPYTGFGLSPEACTEIDFAAATCVMWFSADFPPPAFFVRHERRHCAGYEHVLDSTLSDALRLWKSTEGRGL